ncbi:MAG: transcription antitermination factor NusB, partial [Gammaproteobacteria bacterium]|nr:transcription antitermination factor NusB [Gammaproteobacteria bacterium]
MKSRALATEILNRVCSDAISLDRALDEGLPGALETREQSFIRDLCFGVMRWYPQLDFFLDTLLNKPIRKKDFKLRILCWLGLYQVI